MTEQAEILAASVTAAVSFDDADAAQEYVDALEANPELRAAGVDDAQGICLRNFPVAPASAASMAAALNPGDPLPRRRHDRRAPVAMNRQPSARSALSPPPNRPSAASPAMPAWFCW